MGFPSAAFLKDKVMGGGSKPLVPKAQRRGRMSVKGKATQGDWEGYEKGLHPDFGGSSAHLATFVFNS